jgi:penicillin-binding protein 2
MRQSRFSVEAMLDAPDSSESRPSVRLRVIALVVVALFALLGLRLWTLQVLQAPAAAQAVAANQIRAVTIQPTRGLILDRDGNPLANNVVTQQITLSRVAAVQYPAVVGRLAAVIGETTAQVKSTINDNQYSLYKPVPILSDAPLQDIQYIKEHQSEFPGVSVVATTQRAYPQSELPGAGYPAEQVLGYVGTINPTELKSSGSQGYQAGDPYGQAGLEYQYESELRGTPGQQQLEVNPQGQVVGTLKTHPAVAGDNIVTNIDTNLQQVADNALAAQIAYVRTVPDSVSHMQRPAPNGAVVVLDAQTGAVLAMSSFPTYDPNIWVGGISNANYAAVSATGAQNNYAIQGQLPPGSTFKLVTATSALQTGLITPTYSFDDKGSFTAPNCTGPDCTLKDDVGDTPFGPINVTTALTVSSDTFFYNIGAMYWDSRGQYGSTPIQDTAALYGFGKPTGVDLPNEDQGLVDSLALRTELHAKYPTAYPYTATWYTGDNMELAFGQGSTIVTPLQEAVAYATFANGGTRYAPQVAAAIVSPDGKVVKRIAPQVTGKVTYSPATYAAMMQGFTGVVASAHPQGTGYSTFVGNGWNQAAFPLAGKTGTASLIGSNGLAEEPVSWFVGFGPNPGAQYVVVCEINQGGYGADAAAPVVRNIFNYLAAHPVGAPAIPPAESTIQSLTPVTLPPASSPTNAPTTTTTTTTPTTPSNRSTTPTTAAGGASAGG